MNVLFTDQYGELGGAQRCLLDLLPAVLERGWRAYAAVPDGALANRLAESGAVVETIDPGDYRPMRKSAADMWRFARSAPRLGRQLAGMVTRHRIDLLYVNGPRLLPAACLAGDEVPKLFHAHNYLPQGASRQVALAALRWTRMPAMAVSRYVANFLTGAVAAEKLEIVPNGVEDARRERVKNQVPRVGIIGRIAPEKGHLDFIDAARLLPREWEFVVWGAAMLADPGYEAEVRRRAQGLPITFAGWIDPVADALASLDLLVLPSGRNEALPRVILEAFSAGTPVVAYRSGGIPELIRDGENGYLVEPGRVDMLAARIRVALEDRAGRQSVVDRARRLWEQKYTIERYRETVTQVMARAASRANADADTNTGV